MPVTDVIDSQLPPICGAGDLVARTMAQSGPVALPYSEIDFEEARSCFAVALHMHQPLIPAGGHELRSARIISNLKYMMDHQDIGDNHNAPVFEWCYRRMADFIPQLVAQGKSPRVMLEFSGCLLHGLADMGATKVIDDLRTLATDPLYQRCVEWLGAPWGHAVAPSTPVQDFRLHVSAWQEHFAALFGLDALQRVRGFSPSEMALPSHPDVCYEFVHTLKEFGYRWVLVQEHTVEQFGTGAPLDQPHIPHRLVARSSDGRVASITAIIKTPGSDSKLVARMQPYGEAAGLSRLKINGHSLPPLVTQIADGENGEVMMNEFPSKYLTVMSKASGSSTPAVNVTEYLEHLTSRMISEEEFPPIQPAKQQRIWNHMEEGAGPIALKRAIETCERESESFHMEEGSWTNDISWVQCFDHLLQPTEEASALFAEKVLNRKISSTEHRYRNALFHLLVSQTSCYRHWGEGLWSDYGREICRRTVAILNHDF